MYYLKRFDELSIKYYLNHSMKAHTTLKVGGNAKIYIRPKTFRELEHCISILSLSKVKYKVVGNGSNILVSDKGYEGAIISTKNLNFITVNGNEVTASCGVNLNLLIKNLRDKNLSGLEKLYGIPATVGGAVVMNAGAFNETISQKLIKVCALTNGKMVCYDKNQCAFSYRKSRFLNKKSVVLSATFLLDTLDKSQIDANINETIEFRNKTQPKCRSCGSIFKNDKFAPSGLLIDKCGLKGFTIGNANVSTIHANFINLKEGCTAQEIYDLILAVKQKVKEKFNVSLVEEVEFLGEF